MTLDWILYPALPYAFEAAGLALCLYLFFTVKAETRAAQVCIRKTNAATGDSIAALRQTIEEIKTELHDLEMRAGMLVQPVPPPSGLNLSKRGQVLRMHRRGESAERIAASLSLPLAEVELLVKLHPTMPEQP